MAISERILGFVLVLLFICNAVRGHPNTTEKFRACNVESYQGGDPFAHSLAYVLWDLETVTPSNPGFDYYSISPYPEAVTYGHAACNPELSIDDCITCLLYVKARLPDICHNKIGAQLLLEDCRMRYEQYVFVDDN